MYDEKKAQILFHHSSKNIYASKIQVSYSSSSHKYIFTYSTIASPIRINEKSIGYQYTR